MIGNNSCGATAQRTGKVVDNIAAPRRAPATTAPGCGSARRLDDEQYAAVAARAGTGAAEIHRGLRQLRDDHGDLIRERYPDIPRRVSGYNLDSLLPEHGFDLAGLLVGSEGTLVTVLHAELELVPVVKAQTAGRARLPRHRHRRPTPCRRSSRTTRSQLEGVDHYLIRDRAAQGH